jgi:serine/threonine-protein kinase HipA
VIEKTRKADIYLHDKLAAMLTENPNQQYTLTYLPGYSGPPISLTLPLRSTPYEFDHFPAFFDGLLPEGPHLEALLKHAKLDRDDYLGQLIQVGHDLVGAVTVLEHRLDD